jgi:undecaprenyl-diphosphatase
MSEFLQSVMQWVLAALSVWGYPIVLVATLLENVFVVGSFTPGDLVTAAAAVAAATDVHARISPWGLVVVAAVGSLIGANISYVIGYRGGRGLIERVGPRFGMSIQAIEAAEEYFVRHGSVTIFLARYVAVMKNVVPALAGAGRMSLFWFEFYSVLSALVYAGMLVAVGWFLGENFHTGLKVFGTLSWALFVLVAVLFAGLWVAKRRRDKRVVARNAAAFEREHAAQLADDEPQASDDE